MVWLRGTAAQVFVAPGFDFGTGFAFVMGRLGIVVVDGVVLVSRSVE